MIGCNGCINKIIILFSPDLSEVSACKCHSMCILKIHKNQGTDSKDLDSAVFYSIPFHSNFISINLKIQTQYIICMDFHDKSHENCTICQQKVIELIIFVCHIFFIRELPIVTSVFGTFVYIHSRA